MDARRDARLDAELEAALRAGWPADDRADELAVRYLLTVVKRAYDPLSQLLGRGLPAPPIALHSIDDPLEGATLRADEAGSISVGLGFMNDLNRGVAKYSTYLIENYLWQSAPATGINLPVPITLAEVVSPSDFPREALSFYAANFIPGAVAGDGYVRDDYTSLMQGLRRMPAPGSMVTRADAAALARQLAKPPVDAYRFVGRHRAQDVVDAYRGAPPHYVRLHAQLLLDATQFILAHEAAHVALGHTAAAPASMVVSRKRESDADLAALKTMEEIEGFELRSLVTLFGFINADQSATEGTQPISHPFSADRLVSLFNTVIERAPDETLRTDVNAGMALLYSDHGRLEASWSDGEQATVPIDVSSYSDSDYSTYVQLHVSRPARDTGDRGGEISTWITGLKFGCSVVLRRRDEPESVLRRAEARFRPGGRATSDEYWTDGQGGMFFERTHTIPISPLPEWWLDSANATVALEDVWLTDEPLPEAGDDPVVVFRSDPSDSAAIDLSSGSMETATPVALRMFLVAARRFSAEGRWTPATDCYAQLYARMPRLLLYPDLMNYIGGLQQGGRVAEAADVAQAQLRADRPIRPGYHLALAYHAYEKGAAIETLEHVYWELNGVGQGGMYREQAANLLADLIVRPDRTIEPFVRYMHEYRTAQSLESSDPDGAAEHYSKAIREVERTRGFPEAPPLFALQSSAEALTQVCLLRGGDLRPARRALEDVYQRYPQFVPPVVQLVGLASIAGDMRAAREYRDAALAMAPSNRFVLEIPNLDDAP